MITIMIIMIIDSDLTTIITFALLLSLYYACGCNDFITSHRPGVNHGLRRAIKEICILLRTGRIEMFYLTMH